MDEPNKMQEYMKLKPELTKLEAWSRREKQWQKYYDLGFAQTDKERDEWVTDKLKEEGWMG